MVIDRVKPLKYENPTSGGTETDIFPTETNASEDYLVAKGIALENNDNRLMDLDASGNIQFTDNSETTPITVRKLRTAVNNIFNNTTNGFVATNVQAAIEEAGSGAALGSYYVLSVTPFITSSRVDYVSIPGFSVTPPAGTYLVLYNAMVFYTTVPKANFWAVFIGGVIDDETISRQDTSHSNENMVNTLIHVIDVNGSQAIDIRVKCDNTGTLTVNNRSLVLLRIG
jgi:hypothetical protein